MSPLLTAGSAGRPGLRGCLGRDRLYFPKVAYIFVLYLAYALITSLLTAPSFYLSFFEWGRQILYFLSFVYLMLSSPFGRL